MIITLDVPPELERQFAQAAKMQGKDVSTFLLDSARQRLRADILPQSEAKLLEIINAQVDPALRSERDALVAEQSRRELTDEERATLIQLIDEIEMINARKWQSIAELAHRRGLSLKEIATELQIPISS